MSSGCSGGAGSAGSGPAEDNDAILAKIGVGRRYAEIRTEVCRIARELEGATLERVVALKADVLALERLVTAPIVTEEGGPLGARLALFRVAPDSLCVRPAIGTWSTFSPTTPLQVSVCDQWPTTPPP